ncbi:MAG: hypothetical protein PHR30_09735, partial [Gallionellaceae bacterium]|nr:hypothetical protein [Gallionellaceae bacterium]
LAPGLLLLGGVGQGGKGGLFHGLESEAGHVRILPGRRFVQRFLKEPRTIMAASSIAIYDRQEYMVSTYIGMC